MMPRLARPVILVATALGFAVSHVAGSSAQTPPPKKEAELVAAGHKRLSGQEISARLIGNTIYALRLAPIGGAPAGNIVTTYYRDARVRVSVVTGGPLAGKKLEGNWWIEGNLYCVEQRIINTGHVCYSQYEVGPSVYSCIQPAGECLYLLRIVPGNPDNL